jgi:lipopolysaccharide transport system ATP-binding protein
MNDVIIQVENLGKCYRIAHQREGRRYSALRDVIAEKFTGFFRNWKSVIGSRKTVEDFWALKDVSLEIKQGEVVGIIGRNGAGKSTLLKVLSRITEPTTGKIRLRGRVASLLEVGTGFHPELTGRENVFLNGAILGMQRAEIKQKFDEMVAFAGVEKFLDTPVKRYSSGMYVRLAFSVAAHMDPEILIVDEVLAVGDTQFQLKCLEKIRSVSESGRTVIFVSHNLSTVRSLCKSAVLLEKGRFISKGDPKAVIAQYLDTQATNSGDWKRPTPLPTKEGVFFEAITFRTPDGVPAADFDSDQNIQINIQTIATQSFENVQIGINLFNQDGITVFTTCNTDADKKYLVIPKGRHRFTVEIPAILLPQGRYTLVVISHVPYDRVLDRIDRELNFFIHDVGSHATALKDNRPGVLTPMFPWKMKSLE